MSLKKLGERLLAEGGFPTLEQTLREVTYQSPAEIRLWRELPMPEPIPGTPIIGGARRRLRMVERLRELLQRDSHMDTRQLTVLLLELAERFDQLEELVLASPDGVPVDLKANLTESTRRRSHHGANDAHNALAQHEIAEHTEDLRAEQHAWRCLHCGTYSVGEVCSKCGAHKGNKPASEPS